MVQPHTTATPRPCEISQTNTMALRLEEVTKSFTSPSRERVTVLDIPHLEIADGRQLCLTGGSGSGKTTLLNILAGIVLPTTGSVVFDDVDIARLSETARDRFRAKHVGYVFQTFNLIQGLTALENVVLARNFAGVKGDLARKNGADLLEKVGLSHRASARPGTLSVGEQQRVAIARAVVNTPNILLADEPTANLDEANAEQVLDLLQEMCQDLGSTLLIVTHEPQVRARFSDVVPLSEICRAPAEVD